MTPFVNQVSTALSCLAASLSASLASAQYVLQSPGTPNLGYDDAEITPDGRYAVLRENTFLTSTRVLELLTGTEVLVLPGTGGTNSGLCQDGVAVTDERAVVIGSQITFVDLTQFPPALLATANGGQYPRDVAISPDGTICAVRGGTPSVPSSGGLLLFDAATGALLAQATGTPVPSTLITMVFDVDSVVLTDDHAVFTSYIAPSTAAHTRVTIFDLHPIGGGPPAIVFETAVGTDQIGVPNDITLTPDGQYAAVRSDSSVGLYRLSGAQSGRVWHERLRGDPGPFGLSAMDSIEATNDVIATISRRSNAGFGAQVDVFEISGQQRSMILTGDPHDLTFTPSGQRLLVRTHVETLLYDVTNLPPSPFLTPLDRKTFAGTHTSYGAGVDSVLATDERAVTLSRNNLITDIRVWDISNDLLEVFQDTFIPERPTDLALTPDGTRCVVTGLTYVAVVDLRLSAVTLTHDPAGGGGYPWCDGVVTNDERAVAFGYIGPNSAGWLAVLSLFDEPTTFCASGANSTGVSGDMFATGSARFPAGDLFLGAHDLPPGEFGAFVFADGTGTAPFGDGTFCLGGNVQRMPLVTTGAAGIAGQAVDYLGVPSAGGTITAGMTWYFQFTYRDGASNAAQFNATQGLAIEILN